MHLQVPYRSILVSAALLALLSCGYRFGGGPADPSFPPDVRTVVIKSAKNNTTITGVETELTNDLRGEFAHSKGLALVRSGGDSILHLTISSFKDTPASYRADGKELTRIGVLTVSCGLERADSRKMLWQREFSSSHSYVVTDSISGTLTNRRKAISRMIKELVATIHRSIYEVF
jgi:hypothetical protein